MFDKGSRAPSLSAYGTPTSTQTDHSRRRYRYDKRSMDPSGDRLDPRDLDADRLLEPQGRRARSRRPEGTEKVSDRTRKAPDVAGFASHVERELLKKSETPEIDRARALAAHAKAIGELLALEDASTGQGASTLASVYWAIRDTYRDARQGLESDLEPELKPSAYRYVGAGGALYPWHPITQALDTITHVLEGAADKDRSNPSQAPHTVEVRS